MRIVHILHIFSRNPLTVQRYKTSPIPAKITPLPCCYSGVTLLLLGCYSGATLLLLGCYPAATRVLPRGNLRPSPSHSPRNRPALSSQSPPSLFQIPSDPLSNPLHPSFKSPPTLFQIHSIPLSNPLRPSFKSPPSLFQIPSDSLSNPLHPSFKSSPTHLRFTLM